MTHWEELGMTAEEYVYSRWHDVEIHHGLVDQDEYEYWAVIPGRFRSAPSDSRAQVCRLVAKFTAEHEEAVRLLTYEISLQKLLSSNLENAAWKNPHDHRADGDALLRTIGRLETMLADLKKGMKP